MTRAAPAVSGAERRREKRYEVQLDGELGVDGVVLPVKIADVSGSGALLALDNPPDEGSEGDLWIAGFGAVEIQIAYSGDGLCGVMFTQPAKYRDRLLKWLTEDATGPIA